MTVEELLKALPSGFVVGASGDIYEVVAASSSFASIGMRYPLPPEKGGYFVAKPTDRSRVKVD